METRARLSFPRGEHRDVPLGPGVCTIGSAPNNQIVLAGADAVAHHARIDVDGRGITLQVLDSRARVHVNARPVRERAILRLGDTLSVDTVQILVKPERDEIINTAVPTVEKAPPEGETRSRAVPPKAVLRGVSGSHFGKIVALRARLVIGRGSECDLVLDESEMLRRHAMIESSGEHIFLRDLGSANGTYVNGVQVKDAVLHPGDQIAFDRNRFLLEAPGLPLRGELPTDRAVGAAITQTLRAGDVSGPKPVMANGSRNEIWWLIGAAALIGAAIALLLLV